MGMPELADDPRFATTAPRGRHHARDRHDHRGLDLTLRAADLLGKLHAAGVPAGLVYEPKDMLADPHFTARGSIQTVKDGRHGELTMQAVVPRLSETPGDIRWAAQALGADTEAVLTALLGLTADAVAALRDDGVVGKEARP